MKGYGRLIAGAAVAALTGALGAGTGQAQSTDQVSAEPDSGEIVVTGRYAESLRIARDKKRDSPVVIEALSISDLNQLPDVSVADALSRLPGLAADRDPNNGDKSQISLRGLGPQLTLGTLNGRDLATSTPDRNVRYDQFPSELIGGAVVYKSPMASISEGGVAGSIDLSTVKPLDYKKRVLSGELTGVYSPFGDDLAANKRSGVRGSISYIDHFAHDTIGIAVGIAARSEPFNTIRTEHSSYDPGGYTDFNGDGVSDDSAYQVTQFTRSGNDKRQGAVGVIEWKPSSVVHLTIDSLYSKVKIDGNIHGVIADHINQQFANDYTNTTVIGNHLVGGTVTSRRPQSNTFDDELIVQDFAAIARRNDRLYSLGGNLKITPGGRWEGAVDAAHSQVHYYADYYELRTIPVSIQNGALDVFPNQTVTYDATTKLPTFGNVNFDLTDPSINRPATLRLPFLEIGRDNITTLKGDFVYNLDAGFLDKLRFGARYVDRRKSNRTLTEDMTLPVDSRPVLSGSQVEPFALGHYNGKQRGAAPDFLTFDFFDVANQYFGGLNPVETTDTQAASWVVSEKTLAGYGQLDFGNGDGLSGNVGVRVIGTRDTSSSVRLVANGAGNDVAPFSVKNNYTDVLPSLNLTYKLGPQVQLRLGLAKTIARPAVDDLNAGFRAFDFGNPQAFGGNPKLQPFRANQADAGVEYYFGKSDLIALTGFYKDLKTYITTATRPVDVNGTTFQFFQPVNGSGGHIAGFEATFQKTFNELPSPFDGLGVYANYAFVSSNIKVSRNFSDSVLGLVGLSKHTGTGTIYYSKAGFEGRVSYNYRSSFARVLDGGGFETNDGAGYFDAQISYEVVKGASLVFQASNFTNTPLKTYLGNNPSERGRYEQFGRTFYAGVRLSL